MVAHVINVPSVDKRRWAKRKDLLAGLINTQLAPLVWALVLVLLAIFVRQVRLCWSNLQKSTTAGPVLLLWQYICRLFAACPFPISITGSCVMCHSDIFWSSSSSNGYQNHQQVAGSSMVRYVVLLELGLCLPIATLNSWLQRLQLGCVRPWLGLSR